MKRNVIGLYTRLAIAIALLFGIIFGLLTFIAYIAGYGQPIIISVMAISVIVLQYLVSPKIVEFSMKIKYVSREEMPKLHEIVERLSEKASIPKPKIGISEIDLPNAFAFGRSKRDGRVCVTRGLLDILNDEEMEAVIGHEISHIKHRDMAVITLLSVIPLISYYIFWSSLYGRNRNKASLISALAFIFYLVSNLLVLWVSRLREYYADYGSYTLTGKSHPLASALYRITISTSRIPPVKIKSVEGVKAFFATDPSAARSEINDLRKADLNLDGHLDEYEMRQFASVAEASPFERIMEIFSSHPNVVDRIRRLAKLS
ncbi:MAG: M48 family metalloprotease [Thermoplasmatales archaeon]|nr:M48 family metalloprotease [Thermoplasmatales archaeon]